MITHNRHFDWTGKDGTVRRLCLTAQARADAEVEIGESVLEYLTTDPRSDRKAGATLHAAINAGRRRGGAQTERTLESVYGLIDTEGLAAVVRALHRALEAALSDPDAPPAETPSGNA